MCDLNAIGAWLLMLEMLLIAENAALASITPNLATFFGGHGSILITAMVLAVLATAAVARIFSMTKACTKVCPQIASLNLNLTRIATALAVQIPLLVLATVLPGSLFVSASAIVGSLTLESLALGFIPGDITSLGACAGGTSSSLRAASTLSMIVLIVTIATAALMSIFWLAHQS